MAEKKVQGNLKRIFRKKRAVILAYDHGMEHGPESDFNDRDVNPLYIIDIAKKGGFNAIAVGKGIADKYNREIRASKVPLIVKLSGKTKLYKGEAFSEKTGTVEEAVKLGAVGVGYTIYIGSKYEGKMAEEFSKIEEKAHEKGLVVMLWVYPRGKSIKNELSREMISYAARTGLELDADIVKIKSNGKIRDMRWAVESAGRTKVVFSGGKKEDEKGFLKDVGTAMKAGAAGMAIGRNVWQNKDPINITKKVKKIMRI